MVSLVSMAHELNELELTLDELELDDELVELDELELAPHIT